MGPQQGQVLTGIACMCLAVTLFPVMNAAMKWLTSDYLIIQIVWARFAGHLIYVLLVFMPRRGLRLFATRRPGTQLARSCLLGLSNGFFTTGISFLPLATAAAISFTSPFIVTALAVPMLGEKVGVRRWIAVAVGFAGALLIIRPGSDVFNVGAVLITASAACYALYQILTRKIAAIDTADTSIAYAPLIATIVTTVVLPFFWITPDNWLDWALFGSLGAFGGIGHFLVIKAFERGPAAVMAPFNYVQLVMATVMGYVVFANLPDTMTWIGAAIIVACGIYIAIREARGRAV